MCVRVALSAVFLFLTINLPTAANAAGEEPNADATDVAEAQSRPLVSLDSLLSGAGVEVPESAVPDGLICFGNEPFWSLTFEGAGIVTFNTPDIEVPQSYPVVDAQTARGRPEYPVAIELDAGLKTGLAMIDYEACSDGMSDATHLWRVDLLLKDQAERKLLTGCCRTP